MINLFSFFHINTSFSSIEKNQIPEVIKKCYWPLLSLIEKNDFKIGIEITGYSLEEIYKIDKKWIWKFKELISKKKCELIGSGYTQIISPSVPYELNIKNLQFGLDTYKKYLNCRPNIALVCEQVFSKSLIEIYNKKYNTIILDWIDAKRSIKGIDKKDQIPSTLVDDNGNGIKVIWSNSVAFQKFQRLAYEEISLNDYDEYLDHSIDQKCLCIYSNDTEIFNYRPKRFSTESKIKVNEWKKISSIYNFLNEKKITKFCTLKEISKLNDNKKLKITSASKPIVVKKQPKYNITRWVLCGKRNFELNKLCWKYFDFIKKKKIKSKPSWKQLCYYWSSDFRTHCSKKKLNKVLKNISLNLKNIKLKKDKKTVKGILKEKLSNDQNIFISKNYIKFENNETSCILNKKKGLVIDSFISKKISKNKIYGTTHQGFLNEIESQSDYFSGHTNIFLDDLTKYTELNFNIDNYKINKLKKNTYSINFSKNFPANKKFEKTIEIDLNKSHLTQHIKLKNISPRIIRMINLTLNPKEFNIEKLFYCCHLGGKREEKFYLCNNFNHGRYIQDVTKFTSSNNCLPLTNGNLSIGDNTKKITFKFKNYLSPVAGLIEFKKFNKDFFLRSAFSACESDDTNSNLIKNMDINFKVRIEIEKVI